MPEDDKPMFAVGQRVAVTTNDTFGGMTGEITEPTESGYWVHIDGDPKPIFFAEDELMVTPSEYPAVDPGHYKFGDVEVRQISGHLTSFGGQALQYIARATRLDGKNKGDAIEDLKKSLRFIQWEIERLEAN